VVKSEYGIISLPECTPEHLESKFVRTQAEVDQGSASRPDIFPPQKPSSSVRAPIHGIGGREMVSQPRHLTLNPLRGFLLK